MNRANHARTTSKILVPEDVRLAVRAYNLSVPRTAVLIGVSMGTVEELINVGGALSLPILEKVRARLAELGPAKRASA